ncbi:hypothetical protein [Cognatishimia sp. F0-27]|uniref:hypothetical protein n=1 Tax=Cognatishimia sp. F0-27 TaxID=2816855 RepID=UPI001D0C2E6F|nr:hypothetical protein [Cognatishimia sp. F0-27]MCC1493606.1 hypothetical protein [Cognatishimia sp. F0-27]
MTRIGRPLRMGIAVLAALIVGMPQQARAQDDDGMAFQRCIWRCLASNGPADNPQYERCVARICTEGGIAQVPLPNARSPGDRWYGHVLRDGTAYAGVHATDGSHAFYFTCDASGKRTWRIVGTEMPEGDWDLFADRVTRTLRFQKDGEDLVAPVAGDDALLAALKKGSVMTFGHVDMPEHPIAPLRGSSKAISAAEARCQ